MIPTVGIMVLLLCLLMTLSLNFHFRYSHAMGNSNGNIHEYWKAIDSTLGLQGGFIWEWVDQVDKTFHSL